MNAREKLESVLVSDHPPLALPNLYSSTLCFYPSERLAKECPLQDSAANEEEKQKALDVLIKAKEAQKDDPVG